MGGFSDWFESRFRTVYEQFEGKRFAEDAAGEHMHDEAPSLLKSKTRYKDTLRLMLPELTSPAGLRFADVGGGHLAWFVADRMPGGRSVGFDLGATYAAEARALGVEETHVWDITAGEAPAEPGSFDVVAFCEVLEHLPPPPFPYLQRVGRLLKPGGTLVFTVPNMAGIAKRVKFLFGRSPLKLGEVHWENVGHPHHIREYTVPEVRKILDACGFDVESIRTADHGTHFWRRWTSAMHGVLTRNFGRTILVRAKKRE